MVIVCCSRCPRARRLFQYTHSVYTFVNSTILFFSFSSGKLGLMLLRFLAADPDLLVDEAGEWRWRISLVSDCVSKTTYRDSNTTGARELRLAHLYTGHILRDEPRAWIY